jgi:hypothetical protein
LRRALCKCPDAGAGSLPLQGCQVPPTLLQPSSASHSREIDPGTPFMNGARCEMGVGLRWKRPDAADSRDMQTVSTSVITVQSRETGILWGLQTWGMRRVCCCVLASIRLSIMN